MRTEISSTPARVIVGSLRAAVGSGVYAGLALIAGGRLDWSRGWLHLVVFVLVSVAGGLVVRLANPGLMEARAKGFRKDTKPFDRVFYLLFLPLILIQPLLAGLDAERFGWAPLPWWTAAPGILLFAGGSLLTTWTLIANPHAESTVRVQSERGHVVVSDGPYRFVRHPMYLGTIAGLPGAPLILGSGWSLAPAALIILLFVWRTAREDRALRAELAGYEDFTRITRFRLLPGIW